MEIFVGNLPFDITEQEIRDKFAECGAVSNVKMLMDKFSGRFRGIAFVSMDDEQQAQAAIETLDGAELGGRPMKVDRSRERTERFNGFGGGFRPRNSGRFDNRRREDSDTRQSGEFRRDGGNFRQNPDAAAALEKNVRENFHKLMGNQSKIAARAAGRAVDVSADDFDDED